MINEAEAECGEIDKVASIQIYVKSIYSKKKSK